MRLLQVQVRTHQSLEQILSLMADPVSDGAPAEHQLGENGAPWHYHAHPVPQVDPPVHVDIVPAEE